MKSASSLRPDQAEGTCAFVASLKDNDTSGGRKEDLPSEVFLLSVLRDDPSLTIIAADDFSRS